MDILDDMGVSKLSAKDFSKVNYSFNVVTSCGALQTLLCAIMCFEGGMAFQTL